jgi:hypothetical protein
MHTLEPPQSGYIRSPLSNVCFRDRLNKMAMRPLCAYRLCWTRTDEATPFASQLFPSRCVISLSQSRGTHSPWRPGSSSLSTISTLGSKHPPLPLPHHTSHYAALPYVCHKIVATFLDRFTTHLFFLHVASHYRFIFPLYMACTVCLSRLVCTSPLCYFNTWFGQGGYIISMDRRARFMAFTALNADVTEEDEVLPHDKMLGNVFC